MEIIGRSCNADQFVIVKMSEGYFDALKCLGFALFEVAHPDSVPDTIENEEVSDLVIRFSHKLFSAVHNPTSTVSPKKIRVVVDHEIEL